MQQILVYGDSLSWGIVPGTRNRFEFHERWPGVMECALLENGRNVRVIEDCLNGRRTVLDDPAKPGRNGLVGLEQRIEINSPLALVIIFLGTNDFQVAHAFQAAQSAQGVKSIVKSVQAAPIEPGMPRPEILLISPPAVQRTSDPIQSKFDGAGKKSEGLSQAIRDVAGAANCHFFDAADVTRSSIVDGVHLDGDQHVRLGNALARCVDGILGQRDP